MTSDRFLAAKVTLLGPIPFGGSFTANLDDRSVADLVAHGWSVKRTWQVWERPDGSRFSVAV